MSRRVHLALVIFVALHLRTALGDGCGNANATVSRTPGRESIPCSARRLQGEEHVARRAKTLRRAYVTLLYKTDLVDGARTLGQSLRETGTDADMVVLVQPKFPPETRNKLAEEGWIVRAVAAVATADEEFRPKLIRVYTKLLIADMEDDYDRIVFLDANTLVLENIDELFDCRPFCAVLRDSELLESSVLVVTPSTELYNQMRDVVEELFSFTGGDSDQGFLNSFFPYFAACPAFEPHPALGAGLDGVSKSLAESSSLWGVGAESGSRMLQRRDGNRKLGEWIKPQAWACKRLPTRYNGDWASLSIDERLRSSVPSTERCTTRLARLDSESLERPQYLLSQLVQEGRPEGWKRGERADAPEGWQQRKRVKVLNFSLGAAKPWLWWTYPFFPYVDLWLDTLHRLEVSERDPARDGHRPATSERTTIRIEDEERQTRAAYRWDGAFGQVLSGLAPLAVLAFAWRVMNRWRLARRALRRMGTKVARYAIPLSALDPTSLLGSTFNLTIASTVTVCAAVLAFNAVPIKRLGALRPEAAWAFFFARAAALIVLFSAAFLYLVTLKAQQAFVPAPAVGSAASLSWSRKAPVASFGLSSGGRIRRAFSWAGTATCVTDKGGGRENAGVVFAPRRGAMLESLGHLGVLMVLAVSFVSARPRVGEFNQPPYHGVVLSMPSGAVRALTLLAAFTFSAVRLPPVWAAHGRAWDSDFLDRTLRRAGRQGRDNHAAPGGATTSSDQRNV